MQQVPAIPDPLQIKPSTSRSRKADDNLLVILFLLPATMLFLVFVIYPIFQSVYYSLFNWKGFGPAVDFVGLDNFSSLDR